MRFLHDVEKLAHQPLKNVRLSIRRSLRSSAILLLSAFSAVAQTTPNPQTPATQPRSLAEIAPKKARSRTAPAPDTTRAAAQPPDMAWLQEAMKDQELLAEVGRLIDKVQKNVTLPEPRKVSRILPRLSDRTLFYGSFSNPGDVLHQEMMILKQGLNESPHLQAFLRKNNFDSFQPVVENAIEKFYDVSQYLGDDVVVTGSMQGKDPDILLVAEITRPGLREVLEKLNSEIFTNPNDRLRIFDPTELAASQSTADKPAILVRQDLLVVGLSVTALRNFNAELDQRRSTFASVALGKRLEKAYGQGVSTLIGVDLRQLIGLIPATGAEQRAMLEKTGLTDVNYMVMESTLAQTPGANSVNTHGEVTFNGPRRGIVSWIGAPATLGGLDFVSGNTGMVVDMKLKDPALIFNDLRLMLGESGFASITQMEKQMGIGLNRDILSKLTGEIVIEGSPYGLYTPPKPMAPTAFVPAPTQTQANIPFKIILGVSDWIGLENTITKLLAMAPFQAAERQEDGVTIHTLTPPGGSGESREINYFFLDGYLVIASSRSMAEEALRAHRGGTSLAKSARLQRTSGQQPAQLPKASMILYQNVSEMLAPMLSQIPAELRQLIDRQGGIQAEPTVFFVDADATSLRGSSTSSVQSSTTGGATIALIAAAMAIPSVTRSHPLPVDDSAATNGIHNVNKAESAYSSKYPDRGYASGLALLGPGTAGDCSTTKPDADHACLLDSAMASADCTSGKWCQKSGYRFSIRGVCMMGRCPSYVVSATPAAGGAVKNFCSTEDGVIRSRSGAALSVPVTAAECKTWMPVR